MIIDTNEENFTVPSDPKVRNAIRDAVQEAAAVLVQQDALKDAMKDIVERMAEEFEVPKRTFKRMVKAFHKQNFLEISQDDEVFQTFYETCVESKKDNE